MRPRSQALTGTSSNVALILMLTTQKTVMHIARFQMNGLQSVRFWIIKNEFETEQDIYMVAWIRRRIRSLDELCGLDSNMRVRLPLAFLHSTEAGIDFFRYDQLCI